MESVEQKGTPMRGRGNQTIWEPFDGEADPLDDIEWPDSSLDVDDEEFARAIAEGRGQELDAA